MSKKYKIGKNLLLQFKFIELENLISKLLSSKSRRNSGIANALKRAKRKQDVAFDNYEYEF